MEKNRENRLILRWRIAYLVFCTLGASFSADLMRLHVKVHTDPEYHSYCAISEWANCETVAASNYAVFMGLPVALIGLLGYLAMGALTVWGLRRPIQPVSWPFGLLFWMSSLSSLLSVYLFFLSHYVIEAVCVVCIGTYVVNFILAGLSYKELRRLHLGPFSALAMELKSFRQRLIPLSVYTGVFIGTWVVLWFAVPRYWQVQAATGHQGLPVGTTEGGHPWIGATRPTLVIEEFSDYQCPYCQRGHDEMRKLINTHPQRVRLVHRNYPLDQECNKLLTRPFHPFACRYARLAFCANQQNRFWEANDYLFAHGRGKEPIDIKQIANEIKIDDKKLANCLESDEASAAVAEDLEAGRAYRIRGTPTFVVGERIFPGRIPSEVIAEALGTAD